MKRNIAIWLAFFQAGTICFALAAGEDAASEREEEIRGIAESIPRAKDPRDAAKAYEQLFKLASNEALGRLRRHEHATVAVSAAWEEVHRTVPEKQPPRVIRMDRIQLARFVGFLEGRLRLTVPTWWEDAFMDANANKRGNIWFRVPKRMQHREQLTDVMAAPHVELKERGKELEIKIGKENAVVPVNLEEQRKIVVVPHITATIRPERCYYAIHDASSDQFELFAFERSTNQVIWSSEVWVARPIGGSTGPMPDHVVEIVHDGQRVLVFGLQNNAAYVEAFSAKDGANLFRFSTGY